METWGCSGSCTDIRNPIKLSSGCSRDRYLMRQTYLRSYPLNLTKKKKENVGQRTKKWLKKKRRKYSRIVLENLNNMQKGEGKSKPNKTAGSKFRRRRPRQRDTMMVNLNGTDNNQILALKASSSDQLWNNERYVLRQKYLRSYTFTKKKETFLRRTKKWLFEKQKQSFNIDKHMMAAAAGNLKSKYKKLSAAASSYVEACLIKKLKVV